MEEVEIPKLIKNDQVLTVPRNMVNIKLFILVLAQRYSSDAEDKILFSCIML